MCGRRRFLDCTSLNEDVTPDAVRAALAAGQLGIALDIALRLREPVLLHKVLEATSPEQATFLCRYGGRIFLRTSVSPF